MPARKHATPLLGHERSRVGPPTPARSQVDSFVQRAKDTGIDLFPWQRTVGRYLYAVGPDDQWLYAEVAAIVARQNGKTLLLLPHILERLAAKRKIIHAAQTLRWPRKFFFDKLVPAVERQFPQAIIRRGAGQESITLPDGGGYVIVAATGGAPRGLSADDLLLDEVRELDEDFVGSALPTLLMSASPQVLYLSNAGEETSDVLNAIKARADSDPSLAYLEWSAAPDRAADDIEGWAEANPSLGHVPHLVATLERAHQSYSLAGNLARFETEHLCRWVTSLRQHLVEEPAWLAGKGPLEAPARPVLAFSMDPEGRRASAAIAWKRSDGSIGLRLIYNVTGNPIDTDRLGGDLRKDAARMGIRKVGFDPLTDAALAKFFPKPESISGGKFANATAQFCNLVGAGKVRWADCEAVTDDLTWTARKLDVESGSYEAVRVKDDRPITASLAAVRAVWLASAPPVPSAKVM